MEALGDDAREDFSEAERTINGGAAGRAPPAERARYLATFAEHAALAVALQLLGRPRSPAPPDGGPLDVVFLSAYPISHYGTVSRFTGWRPHLERLGCDVEILAPSSQADWTAFGQGDSRADRRYYHECIRNQWRNIRRAAGASVVVMHRGLFPFSPWQRPTFERQLARLNPRLVYDFYDPIWLQRQAASQLPSRIGRWLHPRDKIEEIIRLSRVVTVSNESLAEFARKSHHDVRVIPMLVDENDYTPRPHEQHSPVVLGWLGSRYNLPKLLSLAPALRRVAAQRDIVVRVVAPEAVEIPGVPVESHTHPWSAESEREDLAALDIGLLPLDDAPDDRGKSPLKLLHYLASGLAIVATPVGIDLQRVTPGDCFLPASTEDEWVECLTRLVDDAALRARLGAAARKVAVEHYTFGSHAAEFHDALLTAAARRESAPVR